MNMNELKKSIYKNNPIAELLFARKGVLVYSSHVPECAITFSIPMDDMGEADFFPTMRAKYLIRWISATSLNECSK